MPGDDRYLVDLYLISDRKGKTLHFRSLPGRGIDFRGGAAQTADPQEVTWALAQPFIAVAPRERHVDFLPDWLRGCPVPPGPQAQIIMPAGYVLRDHRVIHPNPPPLPPKPEALQEFEDALAVATMPAWGKADRDKPAIDQAPLQTGTCARCGKPTVARERGQAAGKYCSHRCAGMATLNPGKGD